MADPWAVLAVTTAAEMSWLYLINAYNDSSELIHLK